MKKYIIGMLVLNKAGVLTRISGMFGRRGFNIDSLVVGETENPKFSRMTITMTGEDYDRDQSIKQLSKMHDVYEIKEMIPDNYSRRLLVVLNKQDLGCGTTENEIFRILGNVPVVRTSLLTMDGAEVVITTIREMFASGIKNMTERNVITSERHRNALERGFRAVEEAIHLLEMDEAVEVCEISVHTAYDALGEIIGETAGEEILDTVFSKFCLGK